MVLLYMIIVQVLGVTRGFAYLHSIDVIHGNLQSVSFSIPPSSTWLNQQCSQMFSLMMMAILVWQTLVFPQPQQITILSMLLQHVGEAQHVGVHLSFCC